MCSSANEIQSIPVFDVVLDAHSTANLYRSYDDAVVGIFVPTWQRLEIGQIVLVSIDLHAGDPIVVHAVVQFLRVSTGDTLGPGLGLAFIMLTEGELDELEHFASQRAPMFYDL